MFAFYLFGEETDKKQMYSKLFGSTKTAVWDIFVPSL